MSKTAYLNMSVKIIQVTAPPLRRTLSLLVPKVDALARNVRDECTRCRVAGSAGRNEPNTTAANAADNVDGGADPPWELMPGHSAWGGHLASHVTA